MTRLTEGPMLQLAGFAFVFVSGGVLWLLFTLRGPTRLVRRATVAYLLACAGVMSVVAGPRAVLTVVGMALGFGLAGMSVALMTLRLPFPRQLAPAAPSDAGPASAAEMQGRSEEAVAARLDWLGDRVDEYRAMGRVGRAFYRFFATPDRSACVYFNSNSGSPMVGVFAAGLTEDGRLLRIANQMDDLVLFPTPSARARTVPAKTPIPAMLAALEAECAEAGTRPRGMTDPIEELSRARDAWTAELVADGRFLRKDGWVRPSLRSLPGVVGRQVLSWLR